jgi:hypothetical protein
MNEEFELVHTMTDFWDKPRAGIANFRGAPHVYQSDYADTEGDDTKHDVYLLMPIDEETFALAMENWAIWRRYETAVHLGKTTSASHPALPEDRQRHEQIKPILNQRLSVDSARAVRADAEFRSRPDPTWSGKGWPPLEVRWTVLSEPLAE